MNEVWIIFAPGGHLLTVTSSKEKAEEIIELEQQVRPGSYAMQYSRVVPNDHFWIARGY